MVKFHYVGGCVLVTEDELTEEQLGKIERFILEVTKAEELTEELKIVGGIGTISTENDRGYYPSEIVALYVGGDNGGQVLAITDDDDSVLIKDYSAYGAGNVEIATAYAARVYKHCGHLSKISDKLYVYGSEVEKVYIEGTDNDNYAVCVRVSDFDLTADIYRNVTDAAEFLRKLTKNLKE